MYNQSSSIHQVNRKKSMRQFHQINEHEEVVLKMKSMIIFVDFISSLQEKNRVDDFE